MQTLGRAVATVVLSLLACSCSDPKQRSATDGTRNNPPAARDAAVAVPRTDASGDLPVPDFQAALTAFRDEVAAQYQTDGAALQIIPSSESVKGLDEAALPGLLAFQTSVERKPVRGWVDGAGTVVLAKKENFGPVMRAADGMDAADVAARIVWAYGTDYKLLAGVTDWGTAKPSDGFAAPHLDTAGDHKVLVFWMYVFGKGGSKVPKIATVDVAPDFTATITLAKP
jgi:hypothetical protein